MNYLAHIFLSGTHPKLQLGNFIGDAVKGSSYKDYPREIAEGILLHRAIDIYTDNHPSVKEAVRSVKPHFGRYSGILLDIYFDYFLASRFADFSDIPLKRFTRHFYKTLMRNRKYLPERIRRFMWHFILTDRLRKYASVQGIRDSLDIMVRVGRVTLSADEAIEYLIINEASLRTVFVPFFKDLQEFCNGYLQAADRVEYLTAKTGELLRK